MNKIYYLSTCDTCKRIINDLTLKDKGFEFQDIKTEKIRAKQLDEMKKVTGSYEALFSRVAMKYKTLNPKPATEKEYRDLILEEYTFLKRPVILLNDRVFVGNSKSVIQEVQAELQHTK